MKTILTTSVGQAQNAAIAINDNDFPFIQTASNEWIIEDCDNESDSYNHDTLIYELKEVLKNAGIFEYDIEEIDNI